MCTKLEVSRSGYYKWCNREKTEEELENEQIALWIQEYHVAKENFRVISEKH